MEGVSIVEKLINIQSSLKAPKNQVNKFVGYRYRNCEDILEAVKPLLKENGLILNISDSLECFNNKVYIKATAKVIDKDNNVIESSAYACEGSSKNGMSESQVTGSASSYARKYALNGLFCIDDTKDDDTPFNDNEDKNKSSLNNEKNNKVNASDEDIAKVMFFADKYNTDIKVILQSYKVNNLKDLSKSQVEQIISRFNKREESKNE